MKKSLLLGGLIVLGILTGCTDENIEETEIDVNKVQEQTSGNQKEEKKSDTSTQDKENGEEIDTPKKIIVNYEQGYTLLQPGEIYRNDTYQVQFTNKGDTQALVNIIDGPEERFFELYKICPPNLGGYEINPQYFVNNDQYQEQFALAENVRIRQIKTYISEKNIESMKACLIGKRENCMAENKAIPYFITDEERAECEGTFSDDPICQKYNALGERYGTVI